MPFCRRSPPAPPDSGMSKDAFSSERHRFSFASGALKSVSVSASRT